MEPHRRRPQVTLSLLTQRFWLALEANPLTVQNITDLYNLSPGENNKTVIVRPASSVVFFLCISRNGFEGQLCKCNLCVMVYSFVLCRKTFALSCTTYIQASCLFLLVNRTLLLLSLDSSKFMSRCFVLT